MTFMANRTERGGCATVGWDDEGVAASSYPIVDKGVFVNYHSETRELMDAVSRLSALKKAPGHSYGENWASIPFPRMPNVSLQPAARNISEDEVLAATDRGIYIEGDGSYSIDQQRYNFQFGGAVIREISNGRLGAMVRDAAYQSRTPDFWASCDGLGGPATYKLWGTSADGKGEPGQTNAVSHGCPPARFRQVTVLNTAAV
jgi:TldD protein